MKTSSSLSWLLAALVAPVVSAADHPCPNGSILMFNAQVAACCPGTSRAKPGRPPICCAGASPLTDPCAGELAPCHANLDLCRPAVELGDPDWSRKLGGAAVMVHVDLGAGAGVGGELRRRAEASLTSAPTSTTTLSLTSLVVLPYVSETATPSGFVLPTPTRSAAAGLKGVARGPLLGIGVGVGVFAGGLLGF
ncbi:hypothetical protein GGR54DRAFT_637968 [Hypoxylon sp. NC1633]|nr:hypothetical protein GGR54DRAFT_637968 [Hypoxylon sp. NC1633]